MNNERQYAPWTADQVSALATWQKTEHIRPFTCRFHNDVILIPSVSGWSCPVMYCRYQQFWAWEYMFLPPREQYQPPEQYNNRDNKYNTRGSLEEQRYNRGGPPPSPQQYPPQRNYRDRDDKID